MSGVFANTLTLNARGTTASVLAWACLMDRCRPQGNQAIEPGLTFDLSVIDQKQKNWSAICAIICYLCFTASIKGRWFSRNPTNDATQHSEWEGHTSPHCKHQQSAEQPAMLEERTPRWGPNQGLMKSQGCLDLFVLSSWCVSTQKGVCRVPSFETGFNQCKAHHVNQFMSFAASGIVCTARKVASVGQS